MMCGHVCSTSSEIDCLGLLWTEWANKFIIMAEKGHLQSCSKCKTCTAFTTIALMKPCLTYYCSHVMVRAALSNYSSHYIVKQLIM